MQCIGRSAKVLPKAPGGCERACSACAGRTSLVRACAGELLRLQTRLVTRKQRRPVLACVWHINTRSRWAKEAAAGCRCTCVRWHCSVAAPFATPPQVPRARHSTCSKQGSCAATRHARAAVHPVAHTQSASGHAGARCSVPSVLAPHAMVTRCSRRERARDTQRLRLTAHVPCNEMCCAPAADVDAMAAATVWRAARGCRVMRWRVLAAGACPPPRPVT
jgi:hypothetical protein